MSKLMNRWFVVLVLLATTVAFASCGSDDDDLPKGNANTFIQGQYKGLLKTPGRNEYKDAILTVEAVANGRVRVSTSVGDTTPKEILVYWVLDDQIIGNDNQGVILFTVANKEISLVTKTSKDEVMMNFAGTKQ